MKPPHGTRNSGTSQKGELRTFWARHLEQNFATRTALKVLNNQSVPKIMNFGLTGLA
jgi:hypothetical protein